MATNPRIPNNDLDRDRRPTVLEGGRRPHSAWGGVTAALAVAVVLLGLVIYFMPRAPKATPPERGAQVPQQAVPGMLQVQDLQIAQSPDNRAMTIQGRINNNGNQTVTGAVAHVVFRGSDGTVVGATDEPIQFLETQGKGAEAHVTGTDAPSEAQLKPNDARGFRLQLNNIPQNWNHEMPEITFPQVASHQ